MTQNPTITYKELADSINKSTSTVKRYIQELNASGAISRIGDTKGGRWEEKWGYYKFGYMDSVFEFTPTLETQHS